MVNTIKGVICMGAPYDLTGKRFGDLEVICLDTEEMERRKKIGKCFGLYWKCKCHACGGYKTTTSGKLVSGSTKNCGCKRGSHQITHNKSKTREYQMWEDIKQKCYNPKNKSYKLFGAQGITVCDEWKNDFEKFFVWYKEECKRNKRGDSIIVLKRNRYVFSPDNCYLEPLRKASREAEYVLLNKRFGKLTVTNFHKRIMFFGKEMLVWNCHCDCGNDIKVLEPNLIKHRVTSCGCNFDKYKDDKFLEVKKKRISSIFRGMYSRCYDQSSDHYIYYGSAGITICDEWLYDGEKFITWALDNGYEIGLSIERKDITKGYSPENCEWIAKEAQARNKSTNVFIKFKNEVHYLAEWGEKLNMDGQTAKKYLLDRGGRIVDNPNIDNREMIEFNVKRKK